MDFTLTQQQRELRAKVIRFAQENLAGQAAELDRNGMFDEPGWKACAEFGALGWLVPEEYGGSGLDPLAAAVAHEALGYGCADNGLVFAINNHVFACVVYLLDHGSAEQRARWLPLLSDGSMVGAHAMSEPGAGSDMLSMQTRARRVGDKFVLSGTKTFISNAPRADLFIVFARTADSGDPQRALSAFIVPRDTPGLGVRPIAKAGLRGTPMGEVTLDNCRVPADCMLGTEGAGYQLFLAGAVWERGFMFASQVGVLARILDRCVQHAGSRKQFGRPIAEFQGVSHKIADMAVRLELARLLLYKVGWLRAQGRLAIQEASMLKLHVSEALSAGALDAMQIHGARGYVEEGGVERELRDALAGTIYAGTSEIQRSVIAGFLGLPSGT